MCVPICYGEILLDAPNIKASTSCNNYFMGMKEGPLVSQSPAQIVHHQQHKQTFHTLSIYSLSKYICIACRCRIVLIHCMHCLFIHSFIHSFLFYLLCREMKRSLLYHHSYWDYSKNGDSRWGPVVYCTWYCIGQGVRTYTPAELSTAGSKQYRPVV